MRSLLLIAVILSVPRPVDAKPSLARAAAALCASEDAEDHEGPQEILEKAGARAIVPMLDAMAAPRGGDDCSADAWKLAVDLLCNAQEAAPKDRATPAFAPVRAALASPEWRRSSAALQILRGLNSWTRKEAGIESTAYDAGPYPRCDRSGPMLASAAGDLGRLLDRTRGVRLDEMLRTTEVLELRGAGTPLVPALVRLLDDSDRQDRAAALLATIGKPAAPAAPRLGRLLARATNLGKESIYASAIASIGAPSPAAAAALPVLLDQAGEDPCRAPTRFVTLVRAAVASGPRAGQSHAEWQGALVSRVQSSFARIGPACAQSMIARDLIIALSRLAPTPELIAMLETELVNAAASLDRRFWAAWALRSLGAQLSPSQAAAQAALLGPPDRPLPLAPEPDTPLNPLSKSDLVSGMNALRPKVAACYARHQVQGLALVNVDIAYGRVRSATVSGKFAGTPTGECVESAVKTGSFPTAQELKTPYPFQLK